MEIGETPRYRHAAFLVLPFCCLNFAALGMQPDQGCEMFKARSALCGFLSQDKGFIVAAEGLEDCRPLTIGRFGIE